MDPVLGMSQVIEHMDRLVTAAREMPFERECIKNLIGFIERLQPIFEQLELICDQELPSALMTALGGIEDDFKRAEYAFRSYKSKSHFYVLTHCRMLNMTMEGLTQSIGQWLSLIPFAGISESRDLRKRIEELSREMQQVSYKVSEAEERLYVTLEKESKVNRLDMVGVGNLWKDLARLIGLDPERNSAALAEQVQLLKKDVKDYKTDTELQKMETILRIFEHVITEPQLTRMYSYKDTVEEEPLQPFESFVCPLTKQIMKEPVVIQSELTYERSAIARWFNTCREQGRDITCPVSGVVLTSTDLKCNLLLKQTIEEWSLRNAKIRIHQAGAKLSQLTSMEEVEEALDGIMRVCEEGPTTNYMLNKSRITPLVLGLFQKKMPDWSQIRSKAFIILQKIAADDVDGQEALVEAGALKAAVRSLSSNLIDEVESAIKFLLEISKQPNVSTRIGIEKGAIIHLLGISSNTSGNAALSLLAEQTLKNLEQVDSNVWQMAEAGRLEPLLSRLCKGPEETKIEMAKYLAERTFVNIQKDHVARRAAKVLVGMLSCKSRAREAGLGALLNLSALEDNVPVLMKAGILPPVVDIIFSVPTSSNPLRGTLKEAAAITVSNIVSVRGSWEGVKIDGEGNTMQSEVFVHRILGLLSSLGPDWNNKLLKIMIGIASSPQAADPVAKHFVSGNGIKLLLALLQGNGEAHRFHVLNLLSVLSTRVGKDITQSLVDANFLSQLKGILMQKNPEESIMAASILSNIPLGEAQLVDPLGVEMISWCLNTIAETRTRKIGSARVNSAMLEGLLGVLLQYARCSDKRVVEAMRQNRLMTHFKQNLQVHGQALTKQRAAMGLKCLSQKSFQLVNYKQPVPMQRWRWTEFFCLSRSTGAVDLCPLHKITCNADETFCLHEANAVGLLVELLEDEDHEVQLAAVEALSTLVSDTLLEAGIKELAKAEGIQPIISWFQTLRASSKSQEKGVYIVERILRVEENAQRYSLDQKLLMALVEAFKHGTPVARGIAEAALAHTNMLSVVSGSGAPKPRNPKVQVWNRYQQADLLEGGTLVTYGYRG